MFAAMEAYCGPQTLAQIVREWGVENAAVPGGEVDPGLLQYKMVEAGNADPTSQGILNKEVAPPKKERPEWNRGITAYTVSENYFGEKIDFDRRPEDYEADPLLRIKDVRERYKDGVTHKRAASSFAQALFGAVYLHAGRAAAKAFFNAHITSRKLDLASTFVFKQPTRELSRLCAREGFESPVARILSETGRNSRTPVFVVGVFSGRDKLGEGTGASLDEARFRAAANALKGWYLYSPMETRVPSDVEGGGKEWKPVLIDGGEVIV
ncbi:MAG: hypothetical protein MMC23_010023 [Stictis urceolatum]|nr:hypothetical protein [Stictis urceolata]